MQRIQQYVGELVTALPEEVEEGIPLGGFVFRKLKPLKRHVWLMWRQEFLKEAKVDRLHEQAVHEVSDVFGQARLRFMIRNLSIGGCERGATVT